uniref:Uncharacterized protein n=1 Tax=Apteryx owenii TaxID=8824 RepID=A0A8B9NVY4_APTOW
MMQGKESNSPDGGYGWVVVASAFLVMGLTAAVLKAFGLFFVEIQQHFDELASISSWIMTITIAIFHLGAPVASSLCVKYTHRAVVITGGLLAFSGMALGFLGLNMKRAVANAIASAGECAFLIGQYGWKGALLIIGGIQLNICVCGALMRPLKSSCLPETSCPEAETPSGNRTPRRDRDKSPITHKTFNWMLVRRLDLETDESQTASLLSILAVVDFAGRLLCGWYANLHVTKTIHLLTMTIALISTSLMLLPLANHYPSLAIFAGFDSFFFGTTVAIHITVTGGFAGPPLAGLIVDMAGDYRAGFYMAGTTLILSVVFLVILDQFQQRKEKKTRLTLNQKNRCCPTLRSIS